MFVLTYLVIQPTDKAMAKRKQLSWRPVTIGLYMNPWYPVILQFPLPISVPSMLYQYQHHYWAIISVILLGLLYMEGM